MCELHREISNLNIFSPPKQYITSILQIVCDKLDYKFGSVIQLDDQGDGLIFASYNLPPNHIESVNQRRAVLSGPAGEAVRTGKIVVINNLLSEPRLALWYDIIKSSNLQTVIWSPLFNQGKVFGIVILYDSKVRYLCEDEMQLLQQIGLTLSIAIASNKYLTELKETTEELYNEISERKRVEDSLMRREQEFKTILDSSPNIVCRYDKQSRYTYMNLAAEKAFGSSFEKLSGKNIAESGLPGDISSFWDAQLQEVFRTGSGKSFEAEYPTEEGIKYYQFRLIPEFREDELPESILCISNDITEYNTIREEQAKASKLESIGILAGGIAHDFNNILTVILGNASLVKINFKPEAKTFNKLEEIEKACLQAKELTNQLLTFSKGGKPIKKPCLISELVKEASFFNLRGSNIKCEFSSEANLPLVEADVGQLNQVISNLIINAKQAMTEGGTIKVNVSKADLAEEHPIGMENEEQEYIKISIEDSGTGIPKEHLSKIFDPYFTTKQDGSGLGLTTSYSIIKKHNGYLSVKSKLSLGTTFFIYLPTCPHAEPMEQPNREEIFSGNGNILVMDDEETIRKLAYQMLTSIGYNVSLAFDGVQAIELYKKAQNSHCPFDAIIMDLTIPGGLGGKETVRQLLQIDPEVKAVVSSGYSNDPILASFKSYGFKGALVKPYKIQELSKVLYQITN